MGEDPAGGRGLGVWPASGGQVRVCEPQSSLQAQWALSPLLAW